MKQFTDRVAVITGGAGGVGAAMAERFATAGMSVVIADLAEDRVATTVAKLAGQGARAIGLPTDVGDLASVEALRDAAYSHFGAVHVLCNNAGVGAGAEGKMWEHTLNDWGWGLNVNLWGMIHGVKAFVPAMLEGGEPGHIVNTSSGNGGIAPSPTPPFTPRPRPRSPPSPRCSTASCTQSTPTSACRCCTPVPTC